VAPDRISSLLTEPLSQREKRGRKKEFISHVGEEGKGGKDTWTTMPLFPSRKETSDEPEKWLEGGGGEKNGCSTHSDPRSWEKLIGGGRKCLKKRPLVSVQRRLAQNVEKLNKEGGEKERMNSKGSARICDEAKKGKGKKVWGTREGPTLISPLSRHRKKKKKKKKKKKQKGGESFNLGKRWKKHAG